MISRGSSTQQRGEIMRSKIILVAAFAFGLSGMMLWGPAVFAAEEEKPLKPVPKEYADKHMPAGGWTNQAMIAAGKKIYEEKSREVELKGEKKKVECASCHGKDGTPNKEIRGV